jgi:hypothetical protein
MLTCGRAARQNTDMCWEYFISRLLLFNLQRLLITLEFHNLLDWLFLMETNLRSGECRNLGCKISVARLSPFYIEGGFAITLFDFSFFHPKILGCFVGICYFYLDWGYCGSGTKQAHSDDLNVCSLLNPLRYSAWLIPIILYVFLF